MRERLSNILIFVIASAALFQSGTALALMPNDPLVNQQYYLEKLRLPDVWDQETGDSSVVVAVIDSGVDTTHPDLRDNIWINQNEVAGDLIDNDGNGYVDDIKGWDFVSNDNDPSPFYSTACLSKGECIEEGVHHGTIVAGVLGAKGNNGAGITGVAWNIKIMPLRALDSSGIGDTVGVTRAIRYAVRNGADIINLSFVGPADDSRLHDAIIEAHNAGVLVVTAVGNGDGSGNRVNLDESPMYPVCYMNGGQGHIVLGVASVSKSDKLSNFSNYGSNCTDLVAPGEGFIGTVVHDQSITQFDEYYKGLWNGTSLSAPIVSGVAALIKSKYPSLTNVEIASALLQSADNISLQNPGFEHSLGSGLIDPVKAFALAGESVSQNKLISGTGAAVYFLANDNKRYVFPDELTYFSWYSDFGSVEEISDSELASYPLGGNVTIRPGTRLVKITTDPKVYAVGRGGVLQWVTTEEIAQALYGGDWNKQVRDIPDAFFFSYIIGDPIDSAAAYNPTQEIIQTPTINHDKGLE